MDILHKLIQTIFTGYSTVTMASRADPTFLNGRKKWTLMQKDSMYCGLRNMLLTVSNKQSELI